MTAVGALMGETARQALTAAFASLWLLDTAATVVFVQVHGLSMEANPLMRGLIDAGGIASFVMVKAAVLALWLFVHRHANIWLHYALVAVMVPVATAAMQVAWW